MKKKEEELCIPRNMSEDVVYSRVKEDLQEKDNYTEKERIRRLKNGGGNVATKNRLKN